MALNKSNGQFYSSTLEFKETSFSLTVDFYSIPQTRRGKQLDGCKNRLQAVKTYSVPINAAKY